MRSVGNQKFEKRKVIEGREVRFTNFIDDESMAFEHSAQKFLGDGAIEQTLVYAKRVRREFYLLQTRSPDGAPAMQAIVYLGRPKAFPFFAMASVPNLGRAVNSVEEEFGLKMLRTLVSDVPSAMTLRLQPQRFELQELTHFELRGARCGFEVSPPVGPIRTLMLGLESSAEALLAKLPQKTRAKLRHASRTKLEIRVITDPKFIEVCREATNQSRKRSGSDVTPYDFESAFDLANTHPDQVRILGLFLKERGEQLLAYVIGYRNGTRAEYASAGAFSDEEIRKMPFNYFLFWELANWAREQGAVQIDMGGITDGGPLDPLQGVSRFKRSIATQEVETGREMVSVLKPLRYSIYRSLKMIQKWLKPEPRSAVAIESKPNQMGLLPAYD